MTPGHRQYGFDDEGEWFRMRRFKRGLKALRIAMILFMVRSGAGYRRLWITPHSSFSDRPPLPRTPKITYADQLNPMGWLSCTSFREVSAKAWKKRLRILDFLRIGHSIPRRFSDRRKTNLKSPIARKVASGGAPALDPPNRRGTKPSPLAPARYLPVGGNFRRCRWRKSWSNESPRMC